MKHVAATSGYGICLVDELHLLSKVVLHVLIAGIPIIKCDWRHLLSLMGKEGACGPAVSSWSPRGRR